MSSPLPHTLVPSGAEVEVGWYVTPHKGCGCGGIVLELLEPRSDRWGTTTEPRRLRIFDPDADSESALRTVPLNHFDLDASGPSSAENLAFHARRIARDVGLQSGQGMSYADIQLLLDAAHLAVAAYKRASLEEQSRRRSRLGDGRAAGA